MFIRIKARETEGGGPGKICMRRSREYFEEKQIDLKTSEREREGRR